MKPPSIPTADEIQSAAARIRSLVIRSPLIRLHVDGPFEIYLKLENLQPIGSFKLRGAGNAILSVNRSQLQHGIYTASAGNMAQGVAWVARSIGIPCRVVVPDHAPQTKLDAIRRLGAAILKVPFDEWWQIIVQGGTPKLEGHFVHPVCDPRVIAGNATVGLEICEDLPDVAAVVVPYGGGGLSCGIASAVRLHNSQVPIFAAEVETAAPLMAALEAGAPTEITYTSSFVDGIGGKSVLPVMWPLAQQLLSGSLVVSLSEVAQAMRLLLERVRVVAEGAGAASVAAALKGGAGSGKIVCVISGGNIDLQTLFKVIEDQP